MKSSIKKIIILLMSAFLSGATLATIITLLFAPKSGHEVRHKMINGFKNVRLGKKRDFEKEKLAKKEVKNLHHREESNMNWFERLVS